MKITKHANRKLYRVGECKAITLPEVVAHIRSGGTVQITCHMSRTDITAQVLRKCLVYKKNLYTEELYSLLRK